MSVELAALEADLVATVDGDSLNVAVQLAIERRKQGRIDLSMLLITKANRTQLDAIEGIQRSIDAAFRQPEQKVIFAKFRQFYPFEMGIENGDDVLALLGDFALQDQDADQRRARLHALEASGTANREELAFFERRFDDGSEDARIAELQQTAQAIDADLRSLKLQILGAVLSTVTTFLTKSADPDEGDKHALGLTRSLFALVTSPTATRHADDVRTER